MKSIALLHWASFTLTSDVPLKHLLPTINHNIEYEYMSGGMHGYTQAWRSQDGAIVLRGGQISMGMHVIVPGSLLEKWRGMGIGGQEVLRYVGKHGARFSRIDLALDVYDGYIRPGNVVSAWRVGDAKMPIRKSMSDKENIKQDETRDIGHTEYFGSRTSQRMLRIYNKGVEAGTGENWIRFELELHKVRAHAVAVKLQDDDLQLRPVINAEFADFLKWENKDWQKLIKDKQGEVLETERKVTNTYKWLIEQVARAMAKYDMKCPDDDIESAFLASYRHERERLRKMYNQTQDK